MQSYQEFERKQAKEIMEHDRALARFREDTTVESEVLGLEDLMKQTMPEPLIDKAYRLHKEQRQMNKRVNLAFNRLAFAVKQQISQDKNGEDHGNVD
mgnify:CR=1 FL=1